MRRPTGLRMTAAALALGVMAALGPAALGAAAAAPAPRADAHPAASIAGIARSGVDDFTFDSFSGDYTLGRDEGGHSTLAVVETFVAVFPESDQNRGIRRELVDSYDGHPTDVEVTSVTDADGAPRSFDQDSDDGVVTLTIAGDDYVHGRQTYVISYTMRNVTRYYGDTDADEFYWDTIGTDWSQPFGSVTAAVHLPADLLAAQTGGVDAASGAQGDDGPAEVTRTDDGFAFSASNLDAGQNLSFAIGFEPGTFTPRDSSFGASPAPALSLGAAVLAVLAAIGAFVLRATRLRDAPGRGIIVPEYLPPKNTSLLLAAVITGRTTASVAAQILALAVSGRVRVVEVEPRPHSRKPGYDLEFVSTAATGREAFRAGDAAAGGVPGAAGGAQPGADELETLHAIFGDTLTPGERRPLGKSDSAALKRLTALTKRVRTDATTDGYRRRYPGGPVAGILVLAFLAGAAAFVFGVISLAQDFGGFWPGIFLGVGLLAMIAAIVAIAKAPLDAKGVELRDYLKGLDEYIRLAEADRIRYLQSPQGAERTPIATNDREQMLKLTERLLPWAVLFGREKQWTAELGRYYEENGSQPGWYVGSAPFNAALFASSIGSVTSSVTTSYSASSGGSGGGAVSGGGGGGGGGGGV